MREVKGITVLSESNSSGMDRERSVRELPKHRDGSNKARQGCDGQWMLNLIYPHALSLEAYLEHWLRDIAISAPSISSAAIESLGGALSYLVREDDEPEFKQVLRCEWRENFASLVVADKFK